MEEITLKQRFEAMNTGESLLLDVKRPVIFVNAKRAKIAVSTKAVNGQIEVTKVGDLKAPLVIPKLPKRKTLLEQLQATTSSERLRLFEHFELCCGMNVGQCICPEEIIETKPIVTPVIAPAGMNDAMARFLSKVDSGPIVEQIEEKWIFSSPKVDFADNGNAYREQYLFSNPKRRRTVQVDYDINDRIIGQ